MPSTSPSAVALREDAVGLRMHLLIKQSFPRLVFVTLIFALLPVGFTNCKHSLSSGKSQWISSDHEMRPVGDHAERSNLRSAVSAEDNSPLSDFARQAFTIVAHNIFIASRLTSPANQRDGAINNYLRDESPILNL
jgi:hypothetical protein